MGLDRARAENNWRGDIVFIRKFIGEDDVFNAPPNSVFSFIFYALQCRFEGAAAGFTAKVANRKCAVNGMNFLGPDKLFELGQHSCGHNGTIKDEHFRRLRTIFSENIS